MSLLLEQQLASLECIHPRGTRTLDF